MPLKNEGSLRNGAQDNRPTLGYSPTAHYLLSDHQTTDWYNQLPG